jgi:hypothetical protein
MLVSAISGLGVLVERSLQRDEVVVLAGEAFIAPVLERVGSC